MWLASLTAVANSTHVLFNAPVEQEIVPPKPPAIGIGMNQQQIVAYLKEAKEDGFAENSIVVRRSMQMYPRRRCWNWGIIKNVNTYKPIGMAPDWLPYDVVWFESGKLEHMWAEELLLVHEHKTDGELDTDFALQEN
jgi:hypothetical protein